MINWTRFRVLQDCDKNTKKLWLWTVACFCIFAVMNWTIIIIEAIVLTLAFTAMILIPLVKNPVWWIADYPEDTLSILPFSRWQALVTESGEMPNTSACSATAKCRCERMKMRISPRVRLGYFSRRDSGVSVLWMINRIMDYKLSTWKYQIGLRVSRKA